MIAALLLGVVMFGAGLSNDVLENAPEGVSLLAPSSVELSSQATLPVVIRRRASMGIAAQVPLEHFAVAVAVDLKRDRVFAARAVAAEDDAPPFEPPSGEGFGEGETTQTVQADLRERLGLPWHAARLQLWAIAGSQRGKPQLVELLGTDSADEHHPDAPLAPPFAGALNHPGIELQPHGHSLRGTLRIHGNTTSALVHLIFVFQDDGFVSQRDFRVTLHAGAGGFEIGPRELAGINPGRPLRVWAFLQDMASNPILHSLPVK